MTDPVTYRLPFAALIPSQPLILPSSVHLTNTKLTFASVKVISLASLTFGTSSRTAIHLTSATHGMSIATVTPKTGSEVSQHGLEWVEQTFSLEPRWTVEPSNRRCQADSAVISAIQHDRVANEVATIDWIHRTTSLPVPRVITYQSSPDNLIGFEWILITKMPGKPLADELAANSACLFRNQLQGIGNIHRKSSAPERSQSTEPTSPTESPDPAKPANLTESVFSLDPASNTSNGSSYGVGQIVSMQFFWGSHIHQNVYRGPFQSSQDWLLARLALNEHDCQSTLEKNSAKDTEDLDSDDECEVEDATSTLKRIERLKSILPLFFPTTSDSGFSEPSIMEPSVLSHDDLSRHNILVDESGNLTAVIDWECVSALPLWKSCYYPQFLQRLPRRLEPDCSQYGVGPYDPTNGDPPNIYLEDLWECQATLLRDVFIDEMKLLDAEWVTVFNESAGK
ncbi:unnamed protein product [Penicillium salamii]|uniref:Aminoglycoside phosphotransferase domain-containing protein n=1 Tax=Penicillium salamii TaxID=1612424 RepID=A0A9W4JYM2_9EURO|nr:unnamed protein product [Penicillium salamii]